MSRTIALAALTLALAAAQAALAQPPSGYGTEGPHGHRLNHQARSTFQRDWNAANESKHRAEASANWVRTHHRSPF